MVLSHLGKNHQLQKFVNFPKYSIFLLAVIIPMYSVFKYSLLLKQSHFHGI